MVFHSFSAPESVRRARSVSPGRRTRVSRWPPEEDGPGFATSAGRGRRGSLGELPTKDLRILRSMARRRREERAQRELADRFNELWRREREERERLDAEAANEYQRFVAEKREWHRRLTEQRQLERDIRQHLDVSRRASHARERQERSAHLLELLDDERSAALWWRRTEETARSRSAALRRGWCEEAEERWRHSVAAECERRTADADLRRHQLLRDSAMRTAISNRLGRLESARLQREAAVAELVRREGLRARVAAEEARARGAARVRADALRRARRLAAHTARLRDALR